jgi:hypothetical protein
MRRRATVEAAASLLFCSAVLASHVEQFHVSQVFLTQAQSKAETFSGKIVSQNGVRFVLRDDDNNVWYHLDDQEKASKLFGKDVLVTGTFDGLTGTIRVQSIVEGTPREKPPAKPEEMKQNREPAKDQAAPLAGTDTVAPSSQQTSPAQEPVGKVPTPSLDSRISSESEGLNHSQNEMSVSPVRGVPPPGFSPETLPTKNLLVGRLLKRVDPSYPLDAIQQRIEGMVRLHVVIGEDGKLQSLEPMSGPPLLVGATVIAVSQWRYAPTLFNGHRIQIQEDIKLEFRLPD